MLDAFFFLTDASGLPSDYMCVVDENVVYIKYWEKKNPVKAFSKGRHLAFANAYILKKLLGIIKKKGIVGFLKERIWSNFFVLRFPDIKTSFGEV